MHAQGGNSISTPVGVISTVTLIITLVAKSHDLNPEAPIDPLKEPFKEPFKLLSPMIL